MMELNVLLNLRYPSIANPIEQGLKPTTEMVIDRCKWLPSIANPIEQGLKLDLQITVLNWDDAFDS